ncbi:MAG: ArgE/DapE family deacylase [Carnobacterium maltaromaticum]
MKASEKVKLLQDIIKIDSTNDNEKEVANYLEKVFLEHGISSKQLDYTNGRSSLITEIGSGAKTLSFSGHMDVVSAGDETQWTYAPFSGLEIDGKVYGRGATDMKGGLAAMVVAMLELLEERDLNGKIRLLATAGEEVGLYGAKQLTEEGYTDGLSAMIIGEPTQNNIVYAHKGVYTYKVVSEGISAHSSMPELGVNAIDKLIVFYNQLQKELSKITVENKALGPLVHNMSLINGGVQINSVPERASLTANVRTIPEFNNEQMTQMLTRIIEKINSEDTSSKLLLNITQDTAPMFSEKDSRIVEIASKVAKEVTGEELPVIGVPAGTDASEFSKAKEKFPIIIFGPGNDTPHQVDEYIEVDNYLEMIDIYKKIAKEYFKN